MSPRCERQVDVEMVTWLNSVTIPRAVYCPHNASPGSPYCAEHQPAPPSLPAA